MLSTRFSCQILTKLEFSQQVLKNAQRSNFMKIRPVGAEFYSMRKDGRAGQTDMTKIIVVFHNFAKASKNISEFAHDIYTN